MRKVVVFVEGQAEQIFVRELLLKYYEYNAEEIGIACYKLISENFINAEFDFGNTKAKNFFQIINAGGDNKVLSAMIKRSQGMLNAGYNVIIGLRDMYSKAYRENSPAVVSKEINKRNVESARDYIKSCLGCSNVHIHYAIMEVETWMLALINCWKGDITDEEIANILPDDNDFELIYHPAEVVKAITSINGISYDKHSSQVNSIISKITKDDYLGLLDSKKCPSYNEFVKDLLEIE